MMTYQGVCKHCGWIQPVMAESQEAADAIIARKCSCWGDAKGVVKVTRGESRRITAEC